MRQPCSGVPKTPIDGSRTLGGYPCSQKQQFCAAADVRGVNLDAPHYRLQFQKKSIQYSSHADRPSVQWLDGMLLFHKREIIANGAFAIVGNEDRTYLQGMRVLLSANHGGLVGRAAGGRDTDRTFALFFSGVAGFAAGLLGGVFIAE
ncbi:hypothetical protein NPIL_594891 [Nephila pilipes]|uniref:Uncharacterized protein n=1 Tax=Nephila pilipes TaxID=299642 RepID=A0A8X6PJK8_NEPPI|nr:hypothetical protein NPIL_594891 [Nephila pilipes]